MIDFIVRTPFLYCLPALQRARLAEDDRFAERVRHSIVQTANDQHRRRFAIAAPIPLEAPVTTAALPASLHMICSLSFVTVAYTKYMYSVYRLSMYNLSKGYFDVKVT